MPLLSPGVDQDRFGKATLQKWQFSDFVMVNFTDYSIDSSRSLPRCNDILNRLIIGVKYAQNWILLDRVDGTGGLYVD